MWYLDTGASSHMTGMKTFYQSLDESHKGVVRFGDGSSIRYEGEGEVHVECTNGEQMIFENVLYIPKLKTKILSLGKLDSQGYIRLRDGFLAGIWGSKSSPNLCPRCNHYLGQRFGKLFEPQILVMDIMWPISQSHFHVSCLCSLEWNSFIVILVWCL